MKKSFIRMLAAILTCGLMMAACGVEVSNSGGNSTDEMHAKIANARWQMTEVLNQNN